MAYCLINFSCFHATITKSPGWRPAFKFYNAWVSLIGCVLCVVVMFLMSWVTALITVAIVVFLYLYVSYRKPDVNWGSSTQAQSFNSALKSIQDLNVVEDHVKNYRPQVLIISGMPSARPPLIDFGSLIVKNLSLMVCAQVVKVRKIIKVFSVSKIISYLFSVLWLLSQKFLHRMLKLICTQINEPIFMSVLLTEKIIWSGKYLSVSYSKMWRMEHWSVNCNRNLPTCIFHSVPKFTDTVLGWVQ